MKEKGIDTDYFARQHQKQSNAIISNRNIGHVMSGSGGISFPAKEELFAAPAAYE
jgi:hypothetical protein